MQWHVLLCLQSLSLQLICVRSRTSFRTTSFWNMTSSSLLSFSCHPLPSGFQSTGFATWLRVHIAAWQFARFTCCPKTSSVCGKRDAGLLCRQKHAEVDPACDMTCSLIHTVTMHTLWQRWWHWLCLSLAWPKLASGVSAPMFCISLEYAVRFPILKNEEVVSQQLRACDAGKQREASCPVSSVIHYAVDRNKSVTIRCFGIVARIHVHFGVTKHAFPAIIDEKDQHICVVASNNHAWVWFGEMDSMPQEPCVGLLMWIRHNVEYLFSWRVDTYWTYARYQQCVSARYTSFSMQSLHFTVACRWNSRRDVFILSHHLCSADPWLFSVHHPGSQKRSILCQCAHRIWYRRFGYHNIVLSVPLTSKAYSVQHCWHRLQLSIQRNLILTERGLPLFSLWRRQFIALIFQFFKSFVV